MVHQNVYANTAVAGATLVETLIMLAAFGWVGAFAFLFATAYYSMCPWSVKGKKVVNLWRKGRATNR